MSNFLKITEEMTTAYPEMPVMDFATGTTEMTGRVEAYVCDFNRTGGGYAFLFAAEKTAYKTVERAGLSLEDAQKYMTQFRAKLV